ncbi:hypothetical protein [Flavobacterium sp.]|uniref:hypothetical protein n=1 Tax=Flavobacterium sp. TaxID=239 RepID=UPI000EC4491F|nr:hypothetical protein [Flavobacterium sp.]HCQ13535.1 hypothetical protein [Flavobacterium sp.]
MNKLFFALILFAQIAQSQEQETASVEKSIFGIQTGFFGAWVHNESKLSNEISLRSEIGINFGLIGGDITGETKFITAPNISFEPRWYYNLSKRSNLGKNIKNNSANFLTLGINYIPKQEKSTYYIPNQISFIPKWAIKRSINHFTYETGIGIGYRKFIDKTSTEKGETALDLHLRIGYTF